MFIVLFTYRTHIYRSYRYMKNLFVLDTCDGSVEEVSVQDIIESGIRIRNLITTTKGIRTDGCIAYDFMIGGNIDDYIYIPEQVFNCWSFYADSVFHVIDMKDNLFIVDDITIDLPADTLEQLAYIFRYRDYAIVRFNYEDLGTMIYHWSTIAIGRNKIIYWDESYTHCNDKSFAMKVDMISGV